MSDNPANSFVDFTQRLKASMVGSTGPDVMRDLGDQACDIVVRRTRLGYGVPDGGNGTAERFSLPELAPSTVKRRKEYQDELYEDTAPARSNLTATGQMLDSIRVVAVDDTSVTIAPTGSRQGSRLGGKAGVTNAAVATHVADNGRPFLTVSRLEFQQLIRYYRNTFGDLLRNNRIT